MQLPVPCNILVSLVTFQLVVFHPFSVKSSQPRITARKVTTIQVVRIMEEELIIVVEGQCSDNKSSLPFSIKSTIQVPPPTLLDTRTTQGTGSSNLRGGGGRIVVVQSALQHPWELGCCTFWWNDRSMGWIPFVTLGTTRHFVLSVKGSEKDRDVGLCEFRDNISSSC